MEYLSIKNWASDDRPREKILNKGVKSLSDAELLAVLIGSGTRDVSAVELGRHILSAADNKLALLGKMGIADLTKTKGIGEAKAVTILAAMEIGLRRNHSASPEQNQISSSREVYNYLIPFLADLPHEEFWVIFMNRSNRIITQVKVSQGGISGTVIDIRLILKKALEVLASSLIIAHNHPSGNLTPSENDKQITSKLKLAASQMDIKLLDHLILANNSYLSFSDEGLIS